VKLPLHIAVKLQQAITGNIELPASSIKHVVVDKMLADGVLQKKQVGKTKAVLFVHNAAALAGYLHNIFGIPSLQRYIEKYPDKTLTRSESVAISGNSKLRGIRTFTGFLVNSFQPIAATLNGSAFILNPPDGSYVFISDWKSFIPPLTCTIIGVENAENFRQVRRLQHLFKGLTPLFVCRYPVSNDLVLWLQQIPNPYLHFGDLDFEGIYIYLSEYKQHLQKKASFFIPPNIEYMLKRYGNRELYNRQHANRTSPPVMQEDAIPGLIALLHKYKKVLEQEIFITANNLGLAE